MPTQPATTGYNPANDPAHQPPKVPSFHRLPLGSRPNVWSFSATDGDGKPVEFAAGKTRMVLRGPTTPNDAKRLATIYLNNERNKAMRDGYADPGYALDEASLNAVGEEEQTDTNVGTWRPDGAVPATLGADNSALKPAVKPVT